MSAIDLRIAPRFGGAQPSNGWRNPESSVYAQANNGMMIGNARVWVCLDEVNALVSER